MIIKTSRLSIESTDIEKLEEELKNPENFPFDDPKWDNRNFIEMFIVLKENRRFENDLFYLPWIISKKNEIRIGNIGFKGDPKDGVAEIGYSLLSDFRGFGYATEAVKSMINFAKSQNLIKLKAKTDPINTASINVLRKCGFEFLRLISEENKSWNLYEINI